MVAASQPARPAAVRERPLDAQERTLVAGLGKPLRIAGAMLGIFSFGWGMGGVGGSPMDTAVYGGIGLSLAVLAIVFSVASLKGRALARAVAAAGIAIEVDGELRPVPPAASGGPKNRARATAFEMQGIRFEASAAAGRRLAALQPKAIAFVGGSAQTDALGGINANAAIIAVNHQRLSPIIPLNVRDLGPNIVAGTKPGGV